MNKQIRKWLGLGLGAGLLAGCLVTGTFVIAIPVDPFFTSNDSFEAHGVDLTTNDVWVDHREDIKNISDVRFRAIIENQSDNNATGQIYFSANDTYTTADQVREAEDAFFVFGGMVIPAGQEIALTYSESAKYRQNLDKALALIEGGEFYIYVLTPDEIFELHVKDIFVLITFDAGP